MNIDATTAINSLRSKVCPACGERKRFRDSLCRACYRALKPPLRAELWLMIGDGYEAALARALEALGATGFCVPEAAGRAGP